MNKKYLLFGIFGILGVMLVSAGLVNYLSNEVTGDVTVESPLALTSDLSDLEGNKFVNVRDFTLENLADIPVSTIVELSVSGDDFNESNFGAEFHTFLIGMEMIEDHCTYGGGDYNSSEGYCYWDASTDKAYTGIVDGVYYVQMGDRENPQPIGANEILNGRLKLRFATNVVGDYTLNAQAVVPELSHDLTLA